jgi:hypothetical protein
MSAERWTPETEGLVAAYLDDFPHTTWASTGVEAARHVLTALGDAGLLLPLDIERHRQYGRRVPSGLIVASIGPDPTHYRLNGPWREVPS